MNRQRSPLILAWAMLLGLSAAWPVTAGAQRDFDSGNRLYEKGRWEQALLHYERVLAVLPDWKAHFNAGNCLYKSGRFLEAKVHFLRARRLNPGERAIDGNLALVNRRFRDAIPPARPGVPERLASWLESRLPANVVDLALLLWAGLANVFLFQLLTRGRRRRRLYGLAASLLMLALCAGWQAQRLAARRNPGTALIRAEKAVLRSGPGAEQTVFFEVHAGLEVTMGERRGEWVYVTASDQVAGWVERGRLQPI